MSDSGDFPKFKFTHITVSPIYVSRFVPNLAALQRFQRNLLGFIREDFVFRHKDNAERMKELMDFVAAELIKYYPSNKEAVLASVSEFRQALDAEFS
jgi:hypothetical protein